MSSTTESKKEGCSSGCGRHKWGPPSEEERQQHEGQFKQAFLDEYHKRHGDSLISAEQTWELFLAVKEEWRAKKKERHPSHDREDSSRDRSHSPGRFEGKRKQMLSELQADFHKDFTAAHGTDKVNANQAWSLIQQVKHNKREKWQNERHEHGHGHGRGGHGHKGGHGHGHGHHDRHSPPRDH